MEAMDAFYKACTDAVRKALDEVGALADVKIVTEIPD